jgi:hypothetical protein
MVTFNNVNKGCEKDCKRGLLGLAKYADSPYSQWEKESY